MRLKSSFFVRELNPSYVIHGKKGSFLKPRGDVQEDVLKLGETPNLDSWGTESKSMEGTLHTERDGKIIYEKVPTQKGNYYDFFEGLYQAIINDKPEPVTAQDGVNVMRIIEAAIQSSGQLKAIKL